MVRVVMGDDQMVDPLQPSFLDRGEDPLGVAIVQARKAGIDQQRLAVR